MNKLSLVAATALLALTGCDYVEFGKVEANGSVAATNASTTNGSAAAEPQSAGISSSRSLAGLTGGGSADGGKDPAGAVPAGAGAGAIDPRLVGMWTDTGDCKTVTELRPDGTIVFANGVSGQWRLRGNTLVVTGDNGSVELRLDAIEADRLVSIDAQGNTGQSTRC